MPRRVCGAMRLNVSSRQVVDLRAAVCVCLVLAFGAAGLSGCGSESGPAGNSNVDLDAADGSGTGGDAEVDAADAGSDAGDAVEDVADAAPGDADDDGGDTAVPVDAGDDVEDGGRDVTTDVLDVIEPMDAVDAGDGSDGGAFDAGDAVADADADADAGSPWVPGRLPLTNWLTCAENSDCPNGTGNCITELPLNRTLPDGRNSIPLVEFLPTLTQPGVCSLSCAGSDSVCETLAFRTDATPWTCQVVYEGPSNYPSADGGDPVFPFQESLSASELAAGPPFGALCRPPFHRSTEFPADFCQPCDASVACLPGAICVSTRPADDSWDTGVCYSACETTDDCPLGFTCNGYFGAGVLNGSADGQVCVPDRGVCDSCRDEDGDGRGVGRCTEDDGVSAEDCDDSDALTYFAGLDSTHAFPASCGDTLDANCNGLSDASEQVAAPEWNTEHCSACFDPCQGSAANASSFACVLSLDGRPPRCQAQCDDPSAFVDCNGELVDGCEVSVTDPSRLYVPDCDGDGFGRPVATPTFNCVAGASPSIVVSDLSGPPLVCPGVLAALQGDGTWGADCNDNVRSTNPSADELCDGVDNDCDGLVDPPEVRAGGAPCTPVPGATRGVCATTARFACDGAGAVVCQPGPALNEVCDGLDNNCDGTPDNFTVSTPENRIGEACRVGAGSGACGAGQLECRSGGLVCIEDVPPTRDEPGDGIDADCDGFDGDLERSLFVQVGGATSGSSLGTRTNPVGSLERAWEIIFSRLQSGATPVEQIYVAQGSYTLPHAMNFDERRGNVRLLGGYSHTVGSDVWTPSASARSTITFTRVCACLRDASILAGRCITPVCNVTQPAVDAGGFSSVRLANVNLVVPVQTGTLRHTVGVRCVAAAGRPCSGLTLQNVTVEVEGGIEGAAASSTPAASGANGGAGGIASGDRAGAGGASSCGAAGGAGGGRASGAEDCVQTVRVGFTNVNYPGTLVEGLPGGVGAPSSGGGSGGLGATREGSEQCNQIDNDATDGSFGATRTVGGTAGGGGASTTPVGPGAGGRGGDGVAGAGGGGGGGGGVSTWPGGNFSEPPGSGGGAGGCPGTGGSAGQPGGSAIGIWIEDSASSIAMTNVEVIVGRGGAGGAGQAGGGGGAGGAWATPPSEGNTGGAGGHGSGGGGGGGGGGGWSVGIARFPNVPLSVVPTVGAGGAGGAGGAAGPGNLNPIVRTRTLSTPVFEASAAGLAGTPGTNGRSVQFCNLSTTSVSGEFFCR